MQDVERCRQAMRAAQKAYMYRTSGDTALNTSDYDKAGIEAIMAETRRIDAEALRNEVVPRGATYEAQLGAEYAADWLEARANGGSDATAD